MVVGGQSRRVLDSLARVPCSAPLCAAVARNEGTRPCLGARPVPEPAASAPADEEPEGEKPFRGFLRIDNSQDRFIETPPFVSLFSGPSEPVTGHTVGTPPATAAPADPEDSSAAAAPDAGAHSTTGVSGPADLHMHDAVATSGPLGQADAAAVTDAARVESATSAGTSGDSAAAVQPSPAAAAADDGSASAGGGPAAWPLLPAVKNEQGSSDDWAAAPMPAPALGLTEVQATVDPEAVQGEAVEVDSSTRLALVVEPEAEEGLVAPADLEERQGTADVIGAAVEGAGRLQLFTSARCVICAVRVLCAPAACIYGCV